MATDLTPTAPLQRSPANATSTLLPAALLFALVCAAGFTAVWAIRAVAGPHISDVQEKHFVFRRLEDPLNLGAHFGFWRGIATAVLAAVGLLLGYGLTRVTRQSLRSGDSAGWTMTVLGCALAGTVYLILALWSLLQPGGSGYQWLHLLIPLLVVAFVYMSWMYYRDAGTVGPNWAAFLATLRGLVYLLLAIVFLLPAWQTWDKVETRSKVIVLSDVSESLEARDDLPTESMPPEKLPTRQDKVIRFLLDDTTAFLRKIQERNPLTLYRFGGILDERARQLQGTELLSEEQWAGWLKPDAKAAMPDGLTDEQKAAWRSQQEVVQQLLRSTNIGDALLGALNREANNMVQGIVVFSDGRSTRYSTQTMEEARNRAKKARIPIFTIAVGEARQPIQIRITDVQAPEQARPDDKFPLRAEIDGEGLPDKEVQVYLDITRPSGEKKTLEKKVKFSTGTAGPPHAQAEFEIDPAELGAPPMGGGPPELAEGEWKFEVRVPRDKREVFLQPMHVAENKPSVQVVKKPLRVLLFGGAASRDFQFIRTLLVREVDKKRAELSVCLQFVREGVVQDVPPERLLRHFPDRLAEEQDAQAKVEEKYYNLAQYDLIIAIDPDWSQVPTEHLNLLEKWVGTHAGGLIVIAGPVNTYQLARPGNRDKLKPLVDLYPVILQDSRLHGLGLDRPTNEPWRLNFPGATAEMEFLKLDDEGKDPLAGWEEFFTGQAKAEGARPGEVRRGFYNYYPLDGVKPNATIVATFADPRARLGNGKEQPWLVTMPYGSGKVVYLGSGESWRLRMFRETFQERFWTKLSRFAGSGMMTRLGRRGVLVMGREFTAGQVVRLEAQLFGRDLQPLTRSAGPKARLKPPTGVTAPAVVELQPKPTQGDAWLGWFQGRFTLSAPGEYRLELQVPETGDLLTSRFLVKEANPEQQNTKPDFGHLYQLSSEAAEVLPRVNDPQTQGELARALEAAALRVQRAAEENRTEAGSRTGATSTETRDSQAPEKDKLRLLFDLNTARLIPSCLVADSRILKSRGPFEDLWDEGFNVVSGSVFGEGPTRMSWLLMLVVGLLSVEWLTRKLLKLA